MRLYRRVQAHVSLACVAPPMSCSAADLAPRQFAPECRRSILFVTTTQHTADAMTPITITYRSNSHPSSIVETTPLDGRDGNSSDLEKSYGSDCDWTDGIEAMRGEQEWSRR